MRRSTQAFFGGILAMWFMAGDVHAQTVTFRNVAGSLNSAHGSSDGTNATGQFYKPTGVAVDGQGNIFVADQFNNTIRQITPDGTGTNWVVSTIAGRPGQYNPSKVQDGTNGSALFNWPTGIAADPVGNLYVADQQNFAIRKMTRQTGTTNWIVTTIAGKGLHNPGYLDGTNSAALFNEPTGIAVDAQSNVFVADQYNNVIREISPVPNTAIWNVITIAGQGPTNAGNTDGTNLDAQFNGPAGMALDANGNLYVADQFNNSIRMMTHSGTNWIVKTIAGHLRSGAADGTNGGQFYSPAGITVDTNGNVFVADEDNSTIRKIAPFGTNWVTSTVGGMAGVTGTSNGVGTNARFFYPCGITVDASGTFYVADTFNNSIRTGFIQGPGGGATNVLESVGFAGNGMMMNYYGTVGSNYTLLASTDFANWTPVLNFTCTNSPVLVADPGALNLPGRFYRVAQGTLSVPSVLVFP